ncbi:MAG: hypothetical protein WC588_00115 [Candidatus Micrarchaeia archaeon]
MMLSTPLRKKALAAVFFALGIGTIVYSLAVIAMADTLQLGMLASGACCLPLALIFWIMAYVTWAEAGKK